MERCIAFRAVHQPFATCRTTARTNSWQSRAVLASYAPPFVMLFESTRIPSMLRRTSRPRLSPRLLLVPPCQTIAQPAQIRVSEAVAELEVEGVVMAPLVVDQ